MADRIPTRDRLLDAAAKVLLRGGARSVTLDAVAAEAAVSKGGLLYHFPTKAALLEGMLERWNDRFDEVMAARAEDRPGGFTRAYLDASDFDMEDPPVTRDEFGLLAALAAEPELLEKAHPRFLRWQQRVEDDGIDPAIATIVRLAADGLWLAEAFHLAPPTGELRQAVIRELRRLTTPPPNGRGRSRS
jgi:AcrR family transcriptional regulator